MPKTKSKATNTAPTTFDELWKLWFSANSWTESTTKGYRNNLRRINNTLGKPGLDVLVMLDMPIDYYKLDKNRTRIELLVRVLKWGAEEGYYTWEPTYPPKPEKVKMGIYMAFTVAHWPDAHGQWRWTVRKGSKIEAGYTGTRADMIARMSEVVSRTGKVGDTVKLKDLLQTWIDQPRKTPIGKGAVRYYAQSVKNILAEVKNYTLAELEAMTRAELLALDENIKGSGRVKKNSGTGARKIFVMALKWLVKAGLIKPQPDPDGVVPKAKKAKRAKVKTKPATPVEDLEIADVKVTITLREPEDVLPVGLTTSEHEYIVSRLADPDQTVPEYLNHLILEDATSEDDLNEWVAAPETHEPVVTARVNMSKAEKDLINARKNGASATNYVRGLVQVQIYGVKAVRVARKLNLPPLDALRLAMLDYIES